MYRLILRVAMWWGERMDIDMTEGNEIFVDTEGWGWPICHPIQWITGNCNPYPIRMSWHICTFWSLANLALWVRMCLPCDVSQVPSGLGWNYLRRRRWVAYHHCDDILTELGVWRTLPC